MKILLMVCLFTSLAVNAKSTNAKIQADKSSVRWTGSKVVGGSHTGLIKIQDGFFKMDSKGNPSSGQVVINMKSMTNDDLSSKSLQDKLLGHLKSDDFFSVAKYPTAKFSIKKVKKLQDNTYQAEGTLSVKGKSQPLKVKLVRQSKEKKAQLYKASFDFDRTDFDIRYGSDKFFDNLGDKVISDKVQIEVMVKLASN